MIMNDG